MKKYPNFDAVSFKNDLTIIQLERDITESEDNGYICIKKNTITNPGTNVYAIGWGFTEKNQFKGFFIQIECSTIFLSNQI